MNAQETSRKEQVLRRLQQAAGGWVDGPELANERCGGSEGLRRLRDLRRQGYPIHERRHPDQSRDIFQYRLDTSAWACIKCGTQSTSELTPSLSSRVMFGRCRSHGRTAFTVREAA